MLHPPVVVKLSIKSIGILLRALIRSECCYIRAAANKNSMLDPVPTWIVKQYCEDLAPFVTRLFNASLKNGCFPVSQKCACVTPVLKKATLDPCNYRPISNLTFISKLLERCVYEQTNTYL